MSGTSSKPIHQFFVHFKVAGWGDISQLSPDKKNRLHPGLNVSVHAITVPIILAKNITKYFLITKAVNTVFSVYQTTAEKNSLLVL